MRKGRRQAPVCPLRSWHGSRQGTAHCVIRPEEFSRLIARNLQDIKFLKEALSIPWRLSTSQIPQRQTEGILDKIDESMVSPSGGFGPVADDGYGVSYMIASDDQTFFHVSSKKSCKATVREYSSHTLACSDTRAHIRIDQIRLDCLLLCRDRIWTEKGGSFLTCVIRRIPTALRGRYSERYRTCAPCLRNEAGAALHLGLPFCPLHRRSKTKTRDVPGEVKRVHWKGRPVMEDGGPAGKRQWCRFDTRPHQCSESRIGNKWRRALRLV